MVQEGENIDPWTGADSEHFVEIDGRRIEVTVEDAGVGGDWLWHDATSPIKRLRSGNTTPDLPLASIHRRP
jgi:hypothetical protein